MRQLIIVLLTFISVASTAQFRIYSDEFIRYNQDTTHVKKHNYINVVGNSSNYSTAITNSLMNAVLRTGYIDDQIKNDTYSKLKEENALGTELVFDISYKHVITDKSNISLRLRDRTVMSSYFNGEIIQFTLGGNKQFEGQKIDISPYEYFKLSYQSVMLGYEQQLKNGWVVGGGVSYLKGGESKKIELQEATIYTAEYGESLEIAGNIHFHGSEKQGTRFTRNNGNGFSIDLYLSKEFANKSKFSFEIQDLGKLYYDELNSYYQVDTTISIEGIEFSDNFEIADSVFSNLETQDVENLLGLQAEPQKVNYTVPALFHINYQMPISKKWSTEIGVRYILKMHKIPQVYLKGIYTTKNQFKVVPTVAYGGLSKLDLGISLMFPLTDMFYFNFDIFYLEAIFAASKSTSQGAGLSVSAFF